MFVRSIELSYVLGPPVFTRVRCIIRYNDVHATNARVTYYPPLIITNNKFSSRGGERSSRPSSPYFYRRYKNPTTACGYVDGSASPRFRGCAIRSRDDNITNRVRPRKEKRKKRKLAKQWRHFTISHQGVQQFRQWRSKKNIN